jgi:hypothetical protein
MSTEDETRKATEEDSHEDLELAEGDSESVAGGRKAGEKPIEYLKVTLKDDFISS